MNRAWPDAMEHPGRPQLDLFDADAELSAIGVTRRQLVVWWDHGFLSFDPGAVPQFERWMYEEIAFLYHLTKVEPSVNALRKLLAPLARPYTLDHDRWFFCFQDMQWRRRYDAGDLFTTAVMENPEHAGEAVRTLIRRLAFFGARTEMLKTLAVLREVLPDDWLRDVLPEE
jgi:hypothetical protein